MHPTLDLDFFEIPVYTALVMLGALAGLAAAWFYLRVRLRRAAAIINFFDGALIVFAAGWIGARAYHVATQWDYYAARPDEIAQIGLGGMAMRGALITGLIALALYARWRKLTFAKLADACALGLALGQAIGWAGALAQGANYGVVSDSPITMDLPDLYGLVAPRFPLQHAEIILFAALFVGLGLLAYSKPRAGWLFGVYLLIASVANLALGFQRGDETVRLAGLWLDQWVDAAGIGIALLFWWWTQRGGKVGINQ
jgi:phosphatidylglycerol:prolipoprotein diacylglycerol transferase